MDKMLKFRLKELRKVHKKSVRFIATKCQVTEKTVYDWEKLGKDDIKSIPIDHARTICKIYNLVAVDELYTPYESFV